jgi:hypothetical protein
MVVKEKIKLSSFVVPYRAWRFRGRGDSDLSPTPLLKERGFGANPGTKSGGSVCYAFSSPFPL